MGRSLHALAAFLCLSGGPVDAAGRGGQVTAKAQVTIIDQEGVVTTREIHDAGRKSGTATRQGRQVLKRIVAMDADGRIAGGKPNSMIVTIELQ